MDTVLTIWGYSEYIKVFEDNEIHDFTALINLLNDPKEAKEVIPIAGVRLAMKEKLRNIPPTKNNDEVIFTERVSESPIVGIHDLTTDSIDEASDVEDSNLIQVIEHTPPLSKKQKLSCSIENLNLRELLLDHPLGAAIIKRYDAKHELCSTSQSILCEIIVLYLIKHITRTISEADWLELRTKIVTEFPCECAQLYYVPSTPKSQARSKKSERSKGKLIDKFRNRKTYIREAENLLNSKVKSDNAEEVHANGELDEVEISRKWLITHREESEVTKHWDKTYTLREEDAKNETYKLVLNIYEKWPILEESSSYELIERDFLRKCDCRFEKFEQRWQEVSGVIIDLQKNKFSQEEELLGSSLIKNQSSLVDKNYNAYVQLTLLSSILVPKSTKISVDDSGDRRKLKKKNWKPTKAESLDGILLHVKIPGDIEKEVEVKRQTGKNWVYLSNLSLLSSVSIYCS